MKLLLLSSALFCSMATSAQVSELNMMFWDNLSTINPGLSGLKFKHHGNASYRNYSKSHIRPSNLLVNYNTRIFKYHGVGINYAYKSQLQWGTHIANLNYNYQWRLKNRATFSMGFALGIQDVELESKYKDYILSLDSTLDTSMDENLTIGFVYNTHSLQIGVSLASITQAPSETNFFHRTVNHLNIHASYTYRLTRKVHVLPIVLLQTDFSKTAANFALLAYYRNTYWLGVGYRTPSAFSVMAGWNIKNKFKLGYAFEHTFTKLNPAGFSNHQVTLGFQIPLPR